VEKGRSVWVSVDPRGPSAAPQDDTLLKKVVEVPVQVQVQVQLQVWVQVQVQVWVQVQVQVQVQVLCFAQRGRWCKGCCCRLADF
jgi:hypothetical protein